MNIKLLGMVAALMFGQALSAQSSATGYKATHEGWLVSLDEAFAQSKKTGKPIMANFTGSDWCGWCKRLSKAVFVHDEFKTWAKKNVVLLELDFPRSFAVPDKIRDQNYSLQQSFGVRGYPTIWVFDVDKDKKTNQYSFSALGKTGYTATVKEFTEGVDQMIAKRKK
ncbi:MAG: thioredoxin family protein [Saprospiraceae bacterium]|mgnify:FL=1|jgi:thiol:disulfide interchange protein|nr:thioredoxin family protein [Saprospiraceae bacterium]MBP9208801.1 thioredoxin family protein [Saprospiraceae bacterium]